MLLAGVKQLSLETDYEAGEWGLRMPYDNFVLTLARNSSGEGALFEQRLGAGRVLLASGGDPVYQSRPWGNDDNAQLLANIVRVTVASDGAVLFDDLRQGLSASYDPARFYRDKRLYITVFILSGLWLVWVLGSTRLRAPSIESHDPSEARAGAQRGRADRNAPCRPGMPQLALFDHFFAGAAPADRWPWLERHAAILPQELDQLKTWYADAHAQRAIPLVKLQLLLDQLERPAENMNTTVASFEQSVQA